MTVKLSICIPTYNRAPLLRELLESIEREASPTEVEIAISDNASSDDTEAVVAEFATRWPSLVYERQPVNAGPDRNYLKCVEISTAPWVWLMGSDDCLARGSAARILGLLRDEPSDIYLGTRLNCTLDMRPLAEEHWLSDDLERFYDFRVDADFLDYHRSGRSLGALFSYLSSIVVRRERWDAFPMQARYLGSAYSHAYLLLQVAEASGIRYVPMPFALNRMGNDHFALEGQARRLLLDLRGYLMLCNDIHPRAGERRDAFLGLLRRAHRPLRTLLALRSRLLPDEWKEAAALLRECGYEPFWIAAITPFHAPLAALLRMKHASTARRSR